MDTRFFFFCYLVQLTASRDGSQISELSAPVLNCLKTSCSGLSSELCVIFCQRVNSMEEKASHQQFELVENEQSSNLLREQTKELKLIGRSIVLRRRRRETDPEEEQRESTAKNDQVLNSPMEEAAVNSKLDLNNADQTKAGSGQGPRLFVPTLFLSELGPELLSFSRFGPNFNGLTLPKILETPPDSGEREVASEAPKGRPDKKKDRISNVDSSDNFYNGPDVEYAAHGRSLSAPLLATIEEDGDVLTVNKSSEPKKKASGRRLFRHMKRRKNKAKGGKGAKKGKKDDKKDKPKGSKKDKPKGSKKGEKKSGNKGKEDTKDDKKKKKAFIFRSEPMEASEVVDTSASGGTL